MPTTSNLGLPLIAPAQAQKHVTHNEALTALDAMVFLAVASRRRTGAPTTPASGERHLIAAGATGIWAGRDGNLAVFVDGGWRYYVPQAGWIARILDESIVLSFDGANWVDLINAGGISTLQNLSRLGVGTTADAANELSFKGSNLLLTAKATSEGGSGDMRAKVNKQSVANIASILFQNGFSGRAELGLLGDDDLVLKLSADGSNWVEALRARASGGQISIGAATADQHALNRITADSRYLSLAAQTLTQAQRSQFLANIGQSLLHPAFSMVNGTIVATVAANALTLSVRTRAGTDPSATDPVLFTFRNAAAATGDQTVLAQTAPLSLTLPSGATLGAANATPFRFWIVAFNDAGTVRLGVVNARSGNNVMALQDGIYSATQVTSGAAASQTIYAPFAVTNKALTILGYIEYGSGLTTAGVYASVPTAIQLLTPGTPLPGAVVQRVSNTASTQFATTSTSFVATPLSVSMALRSSVNFVRGTITGDVFSGGTAGNPIVTATRDGVTAGQQGSGPPSGLSSVSIPFFSQPNDTASHVYGAYLRSFVSGATVYFPITVGTSTYTAILLEEIQT